MLRLTLLTASLFVGGIQMAAARDCRPVDAPPGVRVPSPPGCEATAPRPEAKTGERVVRPGKEPGFIDLGNGSELRVSGRVRVDAKSSR